MTLIRRLISRSAVPHLTYSPHAPHTNATDRGLFVNLTICLQSLRVTVDVPGVARWRRWKADDRAPSLQPDRRQALGPPGPWKGGTSCPPTFSSLARIAPSGPMPVVRGNIPVKVQRTFDASQLQAPSKTLVCDTGCSSRPPARSLYSSSSTVNPPRSLQRSSSNTLSATLVAGRPFEDLPHNHDDITRTTPTELTSRAQIELRGHSLTALESRPLKIEGVEALSPSLELKPQQRDRDEYCSRQERAQEELAAGFLPGRPIYNIHSEDAVDVVLNDLWISTPSHLHHARPRLDMLLRHSILLSILGSGSFGVVVLVQRNCDRRHWAVKIARKDKLATGTSTLHEYVILRAVCHPFIIDAELLLEDDHYVYLVRGKLAVNHPRLTRTCSGWNHMVSHGISRLTVRYGYSPASSVIAISAHYALTLPPPRFLFPQRSMLAVSPL